VQCRPVTLHHPATESSRTELNVQLRLGWLGWVELGFIKQGKASKWPSPLAQAAEATAGCLSGRKAIQTEVVIAGF
jgi:hypothetical protein